MDRKSHVIIGSGINSLVAAAMLAVKGDRVTVLEREATLGGCMRTEEATLPGFRHDVMATTFVLFLTGPAWAALGKDLERHGLKLCHARHPTAVLRPDGSSLVLATDRAANIAAWNALSPGDGDRHAEDVGRVERDAPFLFGLLGGALWSRQTAKLVGGQAWKRGPRGLAEWFGHALTPARAWLETGYTSPLVQALWAPWGLHAGLTPEAPTSGQMGRVIAFALEAAGAPVVEGGAGRAVEAFARLIEEKGGSIRTNADVARIVHAGGRVTGVELAGGEHVAATSILASVTPGQLYGRLLADADLPREKEATRRFQHGRGNFQLHYALDRPPEWLTPGLEDVALIHLTDGIDAVSKSANEGERGMLPEMPTICVGQPHRLDSSRCPEGKAVLWLQIPDGPRVLKGDAKGEIETDGVWTDEVRERFADRIEAILARHIRDFASIRLARRAYSPADLKAMNMNLVGGDPYGGACGIDQFFLWRPFKHSRGGETPLKGLLHIGASTHPGPGLGGGSGFLAAKALGA
ncbi:NAD(P)-binding protein [Paracoccus sp. S-4012]|uniref:phytoene desaturase family protein n=1 Tax=Paracoccus sp. S-4012 TaxID=2665648 RepID=UPI0012B134E1|nr:NAD(P)/FAD-dependent oxidoreductase [Paracoccus sp. S-4012]MRX52040.1 NAD(P)-binding protein [Paracoccus sp. S-4012]